MNHISITTLEAPELDIYARLSEGQLFHYNEPKEGLFIAESPNAISRQKGGRFWNARCVRECLCLRHHLMC